MVKRARKKRATRKRASGKRIVEGLRDAATFRYGQGVWRQVEQQEPPDPDRAREALSGKAQIPLTRNAVDADQNQQEFSWSMARPQFLFRQEGVHVFVNARADREDGSTMAATYVMPWHEAFGLLEDLEYARSRMYKGRLPEKKPDDGEP